MNNFKRITPMEMSDNPFKLIGKDWMLVTSGNADHFNTMTASWGGVGVLWNKNVCFVFVRPSRYTYEFIEKTNALTLSFFTEDYRAALKICGSKSGRDVDKCKETGLIPFDVSDGVGFKQARLVLNCKVLYHQDIDKNNFKNESLDKNYANGDYHRMYVCEITEVLTKD